MIRCHGHDRKTTMNESDMSLQNGKQGNISRDSGISWRSRITTRLSGGRGISSNGFGIFS